jgi:hypothetical protein
VVENPPAVFVLTRLEPPKSTVVNTLAPPGLKLTRPAAGETYAINRKRHKKAISNDKPHV